MKVFLPFEAALAAEGMEGFSEQEGKSRSRKGSWHWELANQGAAEVPGTGMGTWTAGIASPGGFPQLHPLPWEPSPSTAFPQSLLGFWRAGRARQAGQGW